MYNPQGAPPFAPAPYGGGGFAVPSYGGGGPADAFTAPAFPATPGWSNYGPAAGSLGSIGTGGPAAGGAPGPLMFGDEEDYSNEPPLLQGAFPVEREAVHAPTTLQPHPPPPTPELGIDFAHIWAKVFAVLNFSKLDKTVMADADLAGPLVIALALGVCLLAAGKLHFGYIYGFGMMGGGALYLVLCLMAGNESTGGLDLTRTFSVLGYCLLPIVLLAGVAVVYDLRGSGGAVLGVAAVVWCAQSATRFFEAACDMTDQRYLVAYPLLLLYATFALITIF